MEVAKDLNEKRKYPRVYMDLPVEYRVAETPHVRGALVVNASESSLLIHSVKNIPIGTKLNITVLFPNRFELANFEVFAEIIWKDIHWEENWEGCQFGLKFIQLLEEDQQKLKPFLVMGMKGKCHKALENRSKETEALYEK
jgi:hypothetical protein